MPYMPSPEPPPPSCWPPPAPPHEATVSARANTSAGSQKLLRLISGVYPFREVSVLAWLPRPRLRAGIPAGLRAWVRGRRWSAGRRPARGIVVPLYRVSPAAGGAAAERSHPGSATIEPPRTPPRRSARASALRPFPYRRGRIAPRGRQRRTGHHLPGAARQTLRGRPTEPTPGTTRPFWEDGSRCCRREAETVATPVRITTRRRPRCGWRRPTLRGRTGPPQATGKVSASSV